jgi:hypothetical protein
VCNLYSLNKGQAAIIALVRALRDRTGNRPPMPGIKIWRDCFRKSSWLRIELHFDNPALFLQLRASGVD